VTFTTRPELLGQSGAISSTHWLGSQAGMSIMHRGGNAADAAACCGFVLQVLEPHMCGPAGDMPSLVRSSDGTVSVICGQGVAPAAATLNHFRELGLDSIPGTGLLPAVVPGAFGAWLLLLKGWGRLRLREVLEPALALARGGFPVSPGLAGAIAVVAPMFSEMWPSSAAVWLPGGVPPRAGERLRLPALADTYERILSLAEGEGGRSREQEIEAARQAWYAGFVAEEIEAFCVGNEVYSAELISPAGEPRSRLRWRPTTSAGPSTSRASGARVR
jgi:gamma-glutamyltranspeptidase/glutathione hydrolase